jgi:hypothetical protein
MKILPFYTFGGKGEKCRRTFIFLIFSENEAGESLDSAFFVFYDADARMDATGKRNGGISFVKNLGG